MSSRPGLPREPRLFREPGQWADIAAHGTAARYRRHHRDGEKPCEACRRAMSVERAARKEARP